MRTNSIGDVPGSLRWVGPVLRAVEFDADLPFLPTHIDARRYRGPVVANLDLSMWPR